MKFLYRFPCFANPDLNVFTHAVLPNDLSVVVGNNAPDLVELVHFDDEFESFTWRQNSET